MACFLCFSALVLLRVFLVILMSVFLWFLVFLHAPFCCLFLGGLCSSAPPVILYFWGFLCFSAPPTFLLLAFVEILVFLVFLSGVDD